MGSEMCIRDRRVSFSGVSFEGITSFYRTTFNKIAHFERVNIKNADFTFCNFLDEVTFEGAEFGRLKFNYTTFHKFTNFIEVKVKDVASFRDVKFLDDAKFIRTEFHRNASFSEVKFSGLADFSEVKFWSNVWFEESEFLKDALFRATRFYNDVSFENSFFKNADFSSATFFGSASFDEIKVKGNFIFRNVETYLSPLEIADKRISFRRVRFDSPGDVLFDNVSMYPFSFIHTDISRVRFMNVKWPEEMGGYMPYDGILYLLRYSRRFRKSYFRRARENIKGAIEVIKDILEKLDKPLSVEDINTIRELVGLVLSYGDKIFEKLRDISEYLSKTMKRFENFADWEKYLLSRIENDYDLTLENVLSVYRYLRENYDYFLKYEESGKFFVGEMEIKRQSFRIVKREFLANRGSHLKMVHVRMERALHWFVYSVYKLLALYGESYLRPLLFMMLTVLIFSFVKACLTYSISNLGELGNFMYSVFLGDSFWYSLRVFFQLISPSEPYFIFERLFALLILSCLYIALRRKLERRIRH